MRRELSDLQICTRVRGVLARHWLDLGFMMISCHRGTVRLRGELRKLPMAEGPLDEAMLDALDHEIRRIASVRRAEFHLENWVRTSAGWERAAEERRAARTAGEPTRHDLEEEATDDGEE